MRGAGKYDRQVQFQRRTVTQTSFGADETWPNIGPLYWCSVREVNTTETDGGGQVQSTIVTRFVTRIDSFTSTILPGDRIVYQGASYNITGKRELPGARLHEFEFSATARNDL